MLRFVDLFVPLNKETAHAASTQLLIFLKESMCCLVIMYGILCSGIFARAFMTQ